MTELKIPDAAYAAGWEVFRSGQSEGVVTDAVIDAAMPLAFAAELRQLLRDLEDMRQAFYDSDNSARAFGVDGVTHLLRNYIAELDSEGLTA